MLRVVSSVYELVFESLEFGLLVGESEVANVTNAASGSLLEYLVS